MKRFPRALSLVLVVLVAASATASLVMGQAAPKPDAAKPVPYPLDHCLVSGEKLGEGDMGPPVSLVHEGQEFKFCCKSCIGKFNKEPQKYSEMLKEETAAAIKAQKASYPLSACVVSGEKLDADAIDYLYEGQLVRFCCKKCIKEFQASPDTFLAKLKTAGKAK